MQKIFSSFATFVILWALLVPAAAAQSQFSRMAISPGRYSAKSNYAKIASSLMRDLKQNPAQPMRVIVYMNRQAELRNLSPKGMRDLNKLERRRMVVQNLVQTASATQPLLMESIRSKNLLGKSIAVHPFWIFNGFSLTADAQTVYALAESAEVARIYPDEVIQIPLDELGTQPPAPVIQLPGASADGEPAAGETATSAPATSEPSTPLSPTPTAEVSLSWGIEKIGADKVWKELNVTGAGVVVGTIDSGVFWEHPALKAQYRGWNGETADHKYSWFDTVSAKDAPYDDQGHGTHTMGSLVGSTPDGPQTGVAPGAKWIAVKALDSHGSGLASDLLKAMEWMLAPGGDPAYAPDVISNSWGARGCEDTFQSAIDAWIAAGIVPVFSNGNNGAMGKETVGSPACYDETIGVGATDRDDRVADFSSQGPAPDGEIKPDVSAPGVRVRSSMNNGDYGEKSGTSMATPYVAGVAALILSAKPDLDIETIKKILQETALDVGAPGKDNLAGWGRVDAFQAVKTALDGDATPVAQTTATPVVKTTATPATQTTAANQTPLATLLPQMPPASSPTGTVPESGTPAQPTPIVTRPAGTPQTPAPTLSITPSPIATATAPADGAPTDGGPDTELGRRVEDNSPQIQFQGDWQKMENPRFSDGSQRVSKTLGASLELEFSGTRIAVLSTRAPSYGVMYVMVDGAYLGYINLYAVEIQWQQKWTSRVLSPGKHTLKIVHYSGETVNLDAVILFE